ncbi:NDR1/HIN1-like protein 10 [Rutidosis leptorrhynchoides]|uniref:NDR1/HIN1-like protein 10 n=1 Tax=Rutidosis leptorrhynchoides TaxID=125765 RepID=UPI003A999522
MSDPTRPVIGHPAPPPNGYPPPPPNSGSATGYPYAAHPQPSHYFNVSSNGYANPYAANQQRATFLRRIFAVFMACIILTGSIIFIMWIILHPQVPQFRVETLTLTNFTISSNSLVSGDWDARLTVRNPNSKITLYYDRVEAAVLYKSELIAETTVAPFVQGKKNETTIRATFASLSAYVDDRNGINGDRARGTVNFNLRMVARVKFKAGAWWTRRRILRIYCPNLSVGVSGNSTNGSFTGGSKNCKVGL